MGVTWNNDGSKFVTASLDKTCKMWSFDSKALEAKVTKTFTFAKKPAVGDQQVNVVWAGDEVISVSLSGALNYLDEQNPDKPKRIVQGHQKSPRGFGFDRVNNFLYTTDDDGVLAQWDMKGNATWFTGCTRAFENGKGIVACAPTVDGKKVVTVGMDDTYRFHDVKSLTYNGAGVGLGGQPVALSVAKKDPDLAVTVLYQGKLVVFREAKILSTTALDYTPTSVTLGLDDTKIAVGATDSKVRTYDLSRDGKVELKQTLTGNNGRVTIVAYNPAGTILAAGDVTRQIVLFKDGVQQNSSGWAFHASNPTDLSFDANGARLASSGLDQDIIVWRDLNKFEHEMQRISAAHPLGADHVVWADDTRLISSGSDRCVRFWTSK